MDPIALGPVVSFLHPVSGPDFPERPQAREIPKRRLIDTHLLYVTQKASVSQYFSSHHMSHKKGAKIRKILEYSEGTGFAGAYANRREKWYIITDDLEKLDELRDTDFTIMAPISYFCRHRSGKMARFLFALAFDLDRVRMPASSVAL